MKNCNGCEGYESCKVCPQVKIMILYLLESRAKKVPAAAVIQRVQALIGFIGRKERAGGFLSQM